MVADQRLIEQDLVKIRQALEQPTLKEAISAMEQVLASLGYVHLEADMLREERVLSRVGAKNKGL